MEDRCTEGNGAERRAPVTFYTSVSIFFIDLFTKLVPRWAVPPFAFITGLIFYLMVPKPRRGVRANLRTITGRRFVEHLVISTYYKYSLVWPDILMMTRLRGNALFRLIGRRSSSKPLDDALAAGRGAILISPHMGNWELGGLGLAEMGYRLNVMTFREPDQKIADERKRVRDERGIGVIYVDRDDTSPLAIVEAVNALRRNEVVVLLGDRDESSHSIEIPFFGLPSPIPAGAAYLALAAGAPVIPVFVVLENGRYATLMEEPVPVPPRGRDHRAAVSAFTSGIIGVFETYIKKYPDQWFTFFDYWGRDRQEHR